MTTDTEPIGTTALKRVQRSGFWQETRPSPGGVEKDLEQWVYSSLPLIVLSDALIPNDSRVVVVDPNKHLIVHADAVCILGCLKFSAGRNVRIVARKLIFSGQAAGIKTDGTNGVEPKITSTDTRVPQAPRARNGIAFSATDGSPGADGVPGVSGAHGAAGTSAGAIDIYVDHVEGVGHLSARGGDGHAGQDGQDGQHGQSGGHGDYYQAMGHVSPSGNTPPARPPVIAAPGAGGRGGDGGRGGAGGKGGNAGLIRFYVVNKVNIGQPVDPKDKPMGKVTFDNKAGVAGANGKNGEPGVGGYHGRAKDGNASLPSGDGVPIEIELLVNGGAPSHGSIIGLRSLEKADTTQNTLGAWPAKELYYWNDDWWPGDAHMQWRVQLQGVAAAIGQTLRYGDQVYLINMSWNQALITYGDKLSTASGGEQLWTLRPPPGQVAGSELKGGSVVYLQAADGRCVSARSGVYACLSAPPGQAGGGGLQKKPTLKQGERDPWDETKNGEEHPHVAVTPCERTLLSEAWNPTQGWLQFERLNALVLTIDLSGAQNAKFYDDLADWVDLLGRCQDDAFAVINARFNRMAGNHLLKLDAFGYPRDFAPNLSYSFYDDELKRSLESFSRFEALTADVLSSAEAGNALRTEVAAVFNKATAEKSNAEGALAAAVSDLKDAHLTLNNATVHMNLLRDRFKAESGEVKAFEDEISNTYNFCDLATIADCLSMMAFCPPLKEGRAAAEGAAAATEMSGAGVLMAGVQVAKYVEHGWNTIKNVHNIDVQKSDVLGEVKSIDDSLFKSAKQIYTEWGGFKKDLVGRGMLATLDQMEKLVEGFTNLTSAKPLLYNIHALADAVRARMTAITTFNILLREVLDLQVSLEESQRVVARSLAAVAAKNDPELHDHVTFLARQYQEQKDAVIKLVYFANRAYAYWRLDDPDPKATDTGLGKVRNVFRDVMANGEEGVYASIDSSVLISCSNKLRTWFQTDLSAHAGAPTLFPTLSETDGAQIFIRDEGCIKDFKEVRSYRGRQVHYLNFDITRGGGNGSFAAEHLQRAFEVRLTRFRVFIHGAHRESTEEHDSRIQLEFLHGSNETNYTAHGLPCTYSRPELDLRTFIYDGSRKAQRYVPKSKMFTPGFINTDGDIGCGALDEVAITGKYPVYAGISPFSRWTIILDEKANHGITFDDDLHIEIQLLGSCRIQS